LTNQLIINYMHVISDQLKFFVNLAQVQAIIVRALDRSMDGGLGFNDFIILYHLSQAPSERMRRTDLAEKVALTPSGVTRMLLPMEKIGLVKRESSDTDGRVSYVKLAPGGKRLLDETLESAEAMAEELLPSMKIGKLADLQDIFSLFRLGQIIT
jgi:DNA-binding MarR family transcriptional regulator